MTDDEKDQRIAQLEGHLRQMVTEANGYLDAQKGHLLSDGLAQKNLRLRGAAFGARAALEQGLEAGPFEPLSPAR